MNRPNAATPARAGFTMIEAAMASVLVAVMLSAAVAVSGAAGMAQYKVAERATAGALADAMLAEVSALAYADPEGGAGLGRDSGEDASPRTGYDDVDDYNGLFESAPAERDGTAIPGLTGWQRLVTVSYAVVATPDVSSVTDTGLKRIVITIKHNFATVLTRQTLRSSAR